MLDPDALIELLACPDCRSPLRTLTGCDACGIAFPQDEGPPNLMPQAGTRNVGFEFAAGQSTPDADLVARCLRYPPRCGADKQLPYHLDKAHVDVLEALPPGARILEIGCGGAQMRGWIEAKGHEYIGTDVSQTRVYDWLQKHGGADLLCDVHFLPFRDARFDLVYSAAVTEHLACPYLAAQEVARVLKPGGAYLGNVAFMEPWHDDSYFHLSPLGVIEVLTKARLEIAYVWPGWQYSGYRALLAMGNQFTSPIAFVGSALSLYYRFSNRLRGVAKRLLGRPPRSPIEDAARVAGAVDWIARRPA